MRVIVIGGWAPSLVNFRAPLLAEMVRRGHEVVAVAPEPDEEVAQRLNAIGVIYRSVPFYRAKIHPLADLGLILRLLRLFRDFRPNLVLSYTAKPVIYGAYAARLAGVSRYACMITGLGYAFGGAANSTGFLEKTLYVLYRLALKQAETVFFQNPDDQKLFIARSLVKAPQVTQINGSGVDTSYYAPAEISRGPTVFLLAARLLKAKGVYEFVAAARELRRRNLQADFRILGYFDEDGNPETIHPDEMKAWEAEGLITFLGRATDVRPHLAACHVFVLPSYREGTPRTVLEAMSTGRAVITTDVPGCRETVEERVNGLLVPVRDADALANAMQEFIENPELIESMGRASRRIALEKYDVDKVNRTIISRLNL